MKEKILEVLEKDPTLSANDVGKIVGLSENGVRYHIRKLGIERDAYAIRCRYSAPKSKEIEISEVTEQIILGSILGDGSMYKYIRNENTSLNCNSFLYIKHSLGQEEYALYKKALLEEQGLKIKAVYSEPNRRKCFINGRAIKDNGAIEICTIKSISLNKYRDMFYTPQKSICSEVYKLGPLGLAIWFMDDGSKHSSSYYFYTNSFSVEDQQILQDMLKKNFGIYSTIHKTRNHHNLYIQYKSRELLTSIIDPFVCDSMKYKLHPLGRNKSDELREPPEVDNSEPSLS